MTITAGDTRTILTSADPDRADTQQAWDLAVGHDPAATAHGRTPVALWGCQAGPGWVGGAQGLGAG